jgi:hypothetical protein
MVLLLYDKRQSFSRVREWVQDDAAEQVPVLVKFSGSLHELDQRVRRAHAAGTLVPIRNGSRDCRACRAEIVQTPQDVRLHEVGLPGLV